MASLFVPLPLTLPLEQAAAGCEAMDQRRADQRTPSPVNRRAAGLDGRTSLAVSSTTPANDEDRWGLVAEGAAPHSSNYGFGPDSLSV